MKELPLSKPLRSPRRVYPCELRRNSDWLEMPPMTPLDGACLLPFGGARGAFEMLAQLTLRAYLPGLVMVSDLATMDFSVSKMTTRSDQSGLKSVD